MGMKVLDSPESEFLSRGQLVGGVNAAGDAGVLQDLLHPPCSSQDLCLLFPFSVPVDWHNDHLQLMCESSECNSMLAVTMYRHDDHLLMWEDL